MDTCASNSLRKRNSITIFKMADSIRDFNQPVGRMDFPLNMQADFFLRQKETFRRMEIEALAAVWAPNKFHGLVQDDRRVGSNCGLRSSTFEMASHFKISNQ
ncbi:hypothetical protein CEXT_617281 [Caerostris extrusa]|uniref:Uncharacterized protein n=1 Tax=Caerostris extrusa TaxID=172846 RepID=A0AAV4QX37_CAEEX|nr:hypothetical protein CEXT_617281 [Caerostris extrusa]